MKIDPGHPLAVDRRNGKGGHRDCGRRGATEAVPGVVRISNEITIKTPAVTPSDLRSRITQAPKRQVEHEVNRTDIRLDGTEATLRGRVNAWHERDAVQGVAWSASGAIAVTNELTMG
ncbi:BON domain-containing protein [Variovorax sp. YR216]|uniref:BON domain-containing protein n=1 Tax=Variovorax sp. YR216 TaxID=1882828 RepID=UPI00089D42D1|nr:BON domain-containing protein [Variovorax sp. YR216]SEB24389.1 BON domain-containing protein [Variovorax sp. YR216]